MYILIELEELLDLSRVVRSRVDPDVPVDEGDPADRLYELLSDVLDAALHPESEDASALENIIAMELLQDQAVVDRVERILSMIFARVMVRENIRWFRVFDHRGGLAIHVKPGAFPCSAARISEKSFHSTSTRQPSLAPPSAG